MPICRTCRGEYDAIVSLHSRSGVSPGNTAVASSIARLRLCPRCGSNVGVWDQLHTTLANFIILEGGILALLPAAAAMVVWLFWIPREQSGNYFPVLTFVCLGMCALVFFLIYDSRLSWWEHLWAKQIYHTPHVSLTSLIAITAVAGLLLSPLWVLYYTNVGKPGDFVGKVLFAFIYVSAFVCLTAAVTLAIVNVYVANLEKNAPPPIFVDTGRLLQVVVKAAISVINLSGLGTNAATKSTNTEAVYEVLQITRISENGGIHLLLREYKWVEYPGVDGAKQGKLMEMLWQIRADRWGRVQMVRPEVLEPSDGDRRIFREIGRYSA